MTPLIPYDPVGNRLRKVTPSKTIYYTYYPGTNRLHTISDPPPPLEVPPGQLQEEYRHMLNELREIIRQSRGKYLWIVFQKLLDRVESFLKEVDIEGVQFYGYFYKDPEVQEIIPAILYKVLEDIYMRAGKEEEKLLKELIVEMEKSNIFEIASFCYDPTFGYDANGNIITFETGELHYDPLNRLQEGLAWLDDMLIPLVTYSYDGQGRRVRKVLPGDESIFLYDIFGNMIFEQRTVLLEEEEEEEEVKAMDYIYLGAHRVAMVGPPIPAKGMGCSIHPTPGCSTYGAGGGIDAGTFLVNWLIYFLPLVWLLSRRLLREKRYARSGAVIISFAVLALSILVTAKMGWAQNGEEKIIYFHNGHLGQPLKITDGSGNIIWEADYKPFGEALPNINDNRIRSNFRLPGQYYDNETKLHYNMNRYYWPDTGRYITPDPMNLRTIPTEYLSVRFLSAIKQSIILQKNFPLLPQAQLQVQSVYELPSSKGFDSLIPSINLISHNLTRQSVSSLATGEISSELLRKFFMLSFSSILVSNPQKLNSYIYVINNPIIFIDPFGLICCNWNAIANCVNVAGPVALIACGTALASHGLNIAANNYCGAGLTAVAACYLLYCK